MKKNFYKKITIIGAGYWGTVIINTLIKIGIKDITVFDINKKNLKILQKKFSSIKIENNFQKILKNDLLKDVFVATPPSKNYKIVKMLILNNKNIFLEKPGFINLDQIKKIKKILNKKSKFMLGYVYCYNEYIAKIKKILKKKTLGKILYISFNRQNLGPVRNEVDVDYDLTSHDLSIILNFFGKLPQIIAFKKYRLLNNKIADISNLHLKINNIPIDINNSWINPTKERLIKIVGEKKMLIFNEMDLSSPLKIYNQYAKYPKLIYFNKSFLMSKAYIYKGKSKNINVRANSPLENEILYFLNSKKIYTDINFGIKILSILKRV